MRTTAAATPTTTPAIPSRLTAESTPVSTPPSDVVVEVVGRIVVELCVDDETDDVVLEFVEMGAAAVKENGEVVEVLVDAVRMLVVVLAAVVLFVLWTSGRYMVELSGRWVALKATGDRQQRAMTRVVNPLKSRLIGTGVRYNRSDNQTQPTRVTIRLGAGRERRP